MTPTELRLEALRLAVATTGNSNKLKLAEEYLGFLTSADGGEGNARKGKKREGN